MMSTSKKQQHLQISDGDRVVTTADVTTSHDAPGTARAILHAEAGYIPPGSRADLVDAVLELPEVQHSDHLQATIPLGDSESLHHLQHRCEEVTTRPAGSTALLDAELPGTGDGPAQDSSTPVEDS
jgi:uncharacterized phage protein gp47/JayE